MTRTNFTRRTALKAFGSAVLSTGAAGITTARGPGRNGRGRGNTTVEEGESIQNAIDDADAGERIVVEAGTFREQLTIDKDLELAGRDGATVEAPDEMDAFTIPESGPAIEPIVFAYGGEEDDGATSGTETVDVSVTGFEIDGRGIQPDAGRKAGIWYRNVRGNGRTVVSDNTIVDMGVGGQETFGILAYGDSDVVIEGNTVTGFERGGIGANGDGEQHPSPHVVVRDNEVDSGSPREGWAPNGIQVGFGATGEVRGNTVENCRWADDKGDAWAASGILVFESDDVTVTDNTLLNNDAGIGVASWGRFRPTAENLRLMRNSVEDAIMGISVEVIAWDGFTEEEPEVVNNKIVNNELTNTNENLGAVGIEIVTLDASETYDPVVENNKVIRNTIEGFDEQVVDEGETTKVQAIRP